MAQLQSQALVWVWSLLSVVGAIVLWAVSLPQVDLRRMTDFGLVSVFPPTLYLAYAVLTVSFCLLLHRRANSLLGRQPVSQVLLLLHVVVLILMLHATPNILYGTLRYSWTWKHVGIIDYIMRHGSVDPTIAVNNVYHNWPGFFALGALLTEVAGFKSALSYAGWGPAAFNLLDLGALLLIVRSFTDDRRRIWLSVWIFYLTSWVGQDYFSPQAMAYFLHLVILGVLLRWFRVARLPKTEAIRRWLRSGRLTAAYEWLISDRVNGLGAPARSSALQRTGLMALMILLFVAYVSSHQLTPFMTILAVAALVVLQRSSARSLPVLMTVLTAVWALYVAVAFLQGNLYWIVMSIGNPAGNTNSNLINEAVVSPGLRFVSLVCRGLTAGVWVLALLGFLRGLRWRAWNLTVVALALAPFFMQAANSYGGEMLFRVYLFSLPFMAYLVATLVYPSEAAGLTRRTVVLTVGLSGLLLAGLLFAYYGRERMYYFTPQEVAASEYLYDHAPRGALLLDATWNYPYAFRDYNWYTYESFATTNDGGVLPRRQQAHLLKDPVAVVTSLMTHPRYTAAYVIITRSQRADVEMNGWLPPGALGRMELALSHSPRLKLVYANRDATIFKLLPGTQGGAR